MATVGSAERPGSPAHAAAGRSLCASGPGAAGSAPKSRSGEDTWRQCPVCAEAQSVCGGSSTCGHPSGPLCPARTQQRFRRRSDPERSSSRTGKRACDSRREFFMAPSHIPKCSEMSSGPSVKHKTSTFDDRDDVRRRNVLVCKDDSGSFHRHNEPGVLSDSENEEPMSRKIRNISAFIRKTKTCTSGVQRSRSCTDPLEGQGLKLRVVLQPPLTDRVGISHSFTAGILLSSENSRCISAPIMPPDRRLAWRAVVTSSATPQAPPLAPPRPERSISPESNDSISEELNHFKPIVCSPCTPPKRLPDGRLLEPTIVKSTPRNLSSSSSLMRATSYEASPAVLQKWRQIELDRQSLRVSSRATLTSPHGETKDGVADGSEAKGGAKNNRSEAKDGVKCAGSEAKDGGQKNWLEQDGDTALCTKQRKRLQFDSPDQDGLAPAPKVRVRYSSEASTRGAEPVRVVEPCGRKQSFSPYSKNSGFQFVPKDSQSATHNESTSKRKQKTKHMDQDQNRKRGWPLVGGGARAGAQEQRDRALAIRLQRQFDLENQTGTRTRSSLRSWRANQNRRRRGLRRSRRINKH